MNEKQLQVELMDLILEADNPDNHPDLVGADIYTGLEYGLMTNDTALVIKLSNGQVFELTIQERR